MRCLTTRLLLILLALSATADESTPPLVPEGEHLEDIQQILKDSNRGSPYAIDFSPNDRILAVGSFDGTVRLVDIGTGREVRILRGHSRKPLVSGMW